MPSLTLVRFMLSFICTLLFLLNCWAYFSAVPVKTFTDAVGVIDVSQSRGPEERDLSSVSPHNLQSAPRNDVGCLVCYYLIRISEVVWWK